MKISGKAQCCLGLCLLFVGYEMSVAAHPNIETILMGCVKGVVIAAVMTAVYEYGKKEGIKEERMKRAGDKL